jgi:S-(hydroxymethyl)glutathione dehydrogenase/alcohol dehydrogenase
VPTGFGSATEVADTRPGDVVVVIGVGGVGINAVQGARIAGAREIVAVDPVEFKREAALRFGATRTVPLAHEAVGLVRELTSGVMADGVVIAAGVVHADLIPVAMMLTRKGGICVVTGTTPVAEMTIPLILSDMLNSAKQLKGTLYGNLNPHAAMPYLLQLYRSGALKLDELVTRRYDLEDINTAVADLRAGRNLRGLFDLNPV